YHPNLICMIKSEKNYEELFNGLVRGGHLENAKQIYDQLSNKQRENICQTDEVIVSIIVCKNLKGLEFIESIAGKQLNYQKILSRSNNFDLNNIFNQIGKYGVDQKKECYLVLLKYGFDDYMMMANKLYNKFPEILFPFLDQLLIEDKTEDD